MTYEQASRPARVRRGGRAHAAAARFRRPSSASSSFLIFSWVPASRAAATSGLACENTCAANLATLAGLTMKAFEDPGGLVRHDWFIPSGGHETTGHRER